MKLFSILSIGAISLMISGCSMVSTLNQNALHDTITGNIAGHSFSIQSPKDVQMQGFTLIAGTNGYVSLSISNLQTIVNPTNVALTGTSASEIIAAQGTALVNGINAAANAAGTIAGTAVKP